jgi:ADP-ribose pyrophosphatase YjhB (NUDIX family)
MTKGFDEAGLLALSAGHVLLVRHQGEENWRIPRTTPAHGESADAAFARLVQRLGIEVLSHQDLGTRDVDGRHFALRRARIPGLPSAPGHELRLVRLAYLPKELMAPDKPLLDALLSQ